MYRRAHVRNILHSPVSGCPDTCGILIPQSDWLVHDYGVIAQAGMHTQASRNDIYVDQPHRYALGHIRVVPAIHVQRHHSHVSIVSISGYSTFVPDRLKPCSLDL